MVGVGEVSLCSSRFCCVGGAFKMGQEGQVVVAGFRFTAGPQARQSRRLSKRIDAKGLSPALSIIAKHLAVQCGVGVEPAPGGVFSRSSRNRYAGRCV